mgnify:CR=1 FL=1
MSYRLAKDFFLVGAILNYMLNSLPKVEEGEPG